MPKSKLSLAEVRLQYDSLIKKWEAGDLSAEPGRRGRRVPRHLEQIKAEIIQKRKEDHKIKWFSRDTKPAAELMKASPSPEKFDDDVWGLLANMASKRSAEDDLGNSEKRLKGESSSDYRQESPPEESKNAVGGDGNHKDGDQTVVVKSKSEVAGRERSMAPWNRDIKTVKDLEDVLGKHSRDSSEMPALYIYHPPPPEQIVRESKPQNLAADLGSMTLIIWAPRGGACPKCGGLLHSGSKDLASCKIILGSAWPMKLYTTKRQCRSCRHTWVSTSQRYLKTLPSHIARDLTSRYLIMEKSQYGVCMEPILRLRAGALIQTELSVIKGAEEMELSRRRRLYDVTVAKYRNHSLYRNEALGLPVGEIAIPKPEAALSYYTLKTSFIKDFRRHEESLLRELQSYQCDGVLSVDHSRPISKRVTDACKAGGYLCALIDGRGIILNLVLVNSTSTQELGMAFSQLKGRIAPLPEGSTAPRLTLYVDCGCCGTQSSNFRELVGRSVGISVDTIEAKLDPLHAIFRLQRGTNQSCPRSTQLSRSLSKAMFMPSVEDVAALKCRRIQEKKEGDPTRTELRLSVRRIVPPPEILRARLEEVVKTYLVLDEEARKTSGGDGGISNTLFGPLFWSSYTSLLEHVAQGCLSDNPATRMYILDSEGGLRCRRGTNVNECVHSTWKRSYAGVSRLSSQLFDAKSLWKVTFHNRRVSKHLSGRLVVPFPYSIDEVADTELASLEEALVHEGPPQIKFGTKYLNAIDSNALDRLLAEWVANEQTGMDEDDDEEDDDNGATIGVQGFTDFDSFTGVDLGELPEPRDSPDELLAKVLDSPMRRRKFLRLKGLRASTPVVPLPHWSALVKSSIHDIMSSLPANKVTPEVVWREYNKKLLREIDRAVASETECLPLHRISQDNLREYMRNLNNRQSTMATTATGMEAVIRLMEDLASQEVEVPPAEPSTVVRNGIQLNDGPTPVRVEEIVLEQFLRQMASTPSTLPDKTSPVVVPEAPDTVNPPPIRRRSNMLCKYCGLPLAAREFNGHVPDGSRFGRCPKAPPVDQSVVVMKEEATQRAHDYEVVSVEGKGRKCSLCSLPLGATLKDQLGNFVDKHERFVTGENDKDLIWYCPVARNMDEAMLMSLRLAKQQRMKARQARKNEQKRSRYRGQPCEPKE